MASAAPRVVAPTPYRLGTSTVHWPRRAVPTATPPLSVFPTPTARSCRGGPTGVVARGGACPAPFGARARLFFSSPPPPAARARARTWRRVPRRPPSPPPPPRHTLPPRPSRQNPRLQQPISQWAGPAAGACTSGRGPLAPCGAPQAGGRAPSMLHVQGHRFLILVALKIGFQLPRPSRNFVQPGSPLGAPDHD